MEQERITLTQRSSYWDNIKGLMIALVVFGHCLYSSLEFDSIRHIVNAIYFFHMPVFVFVSGYFSKSENARRARSITKLLSAYILLTAVHLIMAFSSGHPLLITTPYNSAWYLLALIAWRLITPYFSKTKWSLAVSVAVALLAGLWTDIDNVFSLARIISLYPFFLAGFFLSEESVKKLSGMTPAKKIPVGIVCFAAASAAAFCSAKFLHTGQKEFAFSAYTESIKRQAAGRISIFLVAALCIIGLLLLMPKIKLPLLTKIGKNSLAIYLIQRPVTIVMNRFIGGFSEWMLLLYAVGFTVVFCIIFGSDFISKLLNKLLGFMTDVFMSVGGKEKPLWQKALVIAPIIILLALPLINDIIR